MATPRPVVVLGRRRQTAGAGVTPRTLNLQVRWACEQVRFISGSWFLRLSKLNAFDRAAHSWF